MDMITLIGFLAGGLTTASFLPQVVKTARTRSARDLSVAMLLVFLIGLSLWTVYGIQVGSPPLIFTNLATIALVAAILAMKVKFREREKVCPPEQGK
ncbi:MAG TPA: SemiSWEET transporter [Methanomicrobiales archaeon]|nr:SemiSWEET transporter [Methanomicrobiales archaeon]